MNDNTTSTPEELATKLSSLRQRAEELVKEIRDIEAQLKPRRTWAEIAAEQWKTAYNPETGKLDQ